MCLVDRCDKKVIAKGLCENHYRRMRRNGDPNIHINQPWGEARTVRADGYIYITVNGKQVMEHRHKMEQKLGRKLTDKEIVHHINGRVQDNRLENLEVMTKSEHSSLHGVQGHYNKLGRVRV